MIREEEKHEDLSSGLRCPWWLCFAGGAVVNGAKDPECNLLQGGQKVVGEQANKKPERRAGRWPC
jgi:hypothetical protein